MDTPDLVADIGGTNARFALTDDDGALQHVHVLRCAMYPTLVDAVHAYLQRALPPRTDANADDRIWPRRAALAVATPVVADHVDMTNHVWSFSIAATRRALGLDALTVVNDFTAQALSLLALGADDLRPLYAPSGPSSGDDPAATAGGQSAPVAAPPRAILGAGTGLGVSALISAGDDRYTALETEGGHRSMAPANEREWAIHQHLFARYGHVSCERLLSGPGLLHLLEAICAIDGVAPAADDPPEIVERAADGTCPRCAETVRVFSGQLGSVAGDLALTLGARGGVYVAGGIVPKMGATFDTAAFRARFLSKGRFRDYVARIPVHLVIHEQPGLLGAVQALHRGRAGRRAVAPEGTAR
ncbi:MAG: glucokinase [Acidobacteriota bacterium]